MTAVTMCLGTCSWLLNKEARYLHVFPSLQHDVCLSVTCPGIFFTLEFQVRKISVTEVPNLSQSRRFKDCPQCLEVLHKIPYRFHTWQALMLEAIVISSTDPKL